MRPIAHDAAAAQRAIDAARSLHLLLESVARHRDALVRSARAEWLGRHRLDFDRLDDQLRLAQEQIALELAALRTGLADDLETIRDENRSRAAARQRWEARQQAAGAGVLP